MRSDLDLERGMITGQRTRTRTRRVCVTGGTFRGQGNAKNSGNSGQTTPADHPIPHATEEKCCATSSSQALRKRVDILRII